MGHGTALVGAVQWGPIHRFGAIILQALLPGDEDYARVLMANILTRPMDMTAREPIEPEAPLTLSDKVPSVLKLAVSVGNAGIYTDVPAEKSLPSSLRTDTYISECTLRSSD